MTGLINFMNGTVGRILRVVLGLVLIWLGFLGPGAGQTWGTVVGILGFLPVILGLWGRCLLQFIPGVKTS